MMLSLIAANGGTYGFDCDTAAPSTAEETAAANAATLVWKLRAIFVLWNEVEVEETIGYYGAPDEEAAKALGLARLGLAKEARRIATNVLSRVIAHKENEAQAKLRFHHEVGHSAYLVHPYQAWLRVVADDAIARIDGTKPLDATAPDRADMARLIK